MALATPVRIASLAALLIAAPQAPDLLASLRDDLKSVGSTTAAERELSPAVSADLPEAVLTGAATTIPERASFYVVVGDNLELSPTTRASIVGLLRYWLLPRRFVTRAAAEWVIAYGASTETLGVRLGRQVEVHPGVVVVEVARG